MKFGTVPIHKATGCILGHTHRLGATIVRKGTMIGTEHMELFQLNSYTEVVVAELEADDVLENQAAAQIAAELISEHMSSTSAIAGRCNIRSNVHGLLCYDRQKLEDINCLDWRVTIAAKEPFGVIYSEQVVVTVKIIPYSVPKGLVDKVLEEVAECFAVRPFIPHHAALILSVHRKRNALAEQRAIAAQEERLVALGSSLGRVVFCDHTQESAAKILDVIHKEGWNPILFLGASAVVDEYDVFPNAIRECGGIVKHIGMPVDPGNMLVLAEIHKTPIVGIPGCARSTKKSGFDWVLQRLLCKMSVETRDIMRMGVGGLRSAPVRTSFSISKERRVGAVVLMAGTSSRMGKENKLLVEIDGVAIGEQVIRTIKEAGFSPIVVVTGYGADQVRAMLHDMDVLFVHNEQYAEGMGSSIRKAFSSIYGWDAGMVVMGDMPFVSKQTLCEIKEAYVLQGHSLVVPCVSEKLGQPVLFSVEYFEQLLKCSGDTGARHILEKNRESIHLLEVKDQSIFWDVDTPENIIVHQERIRHE